MVTQRGFIQGMKSSNYLVQHTKEKHKKILLNSFHLNGHTIGSGSFNRIVWLEVLLQNRWKGQMIGLQEYTKATEVDIFLGNNQGKPQQPWQNTKSLLSLFVEIKKQYIGIPPRQETVTIGWVKAK